MEIMFLRLPRVFSLKVLRGCLRVLIHRLMSTFREHCSSFHQGEKQPDTVSVLLVISQHLYMEMILHRNYTK